MVLETALTLQVSLVLCCELTVLAGFILVIRRFSIQTKTKKQMYWKRPHVSHAQMSAKTIFRFLCSDKMCFTFDLAIMVGWGLKNNALPSRHL